MKQRRKKGWKFSSWRCGRRTCRKEMTIRAGNPFSYYATNPLKRDSKLELRSIPELIWHWLYAECLIRTVAAETKHSAETIVECWHTNRSVCSAVIAAEPRFKGTEAQPVQVDESYFCGRRKYSRGRLVRGDTKQTVREKSDDEEVSGCGVDDERDNLAKMGTTGHG